uniref:Uncharacterized protein n=1 Tax=Anopheles maculatus TaxID=74869 RepID=A0A182SI46_9DIPT
MAHSEPAPTDDTRAPTVDELVSLGNRIGLAIDSNGIEELLTEYLEDLSTGDPFYGTHLQKVNNRKQVSAAAVQTNPLSTEDIRKVLNAWDTVSSYVCKYHPDETVTRRVNGMYETNVISHFRAILKRRQKQSKIDHFFKKINQGK